MNEPPSPPPSREPRALLERLRALPAAAPLLDVLPDEPPVYLVGGAVRDLLMGGRPVDLDLVVEGDAAALADRLGGQVRWHDRFGTSTVRLDGRDYDIARARTETYPHPGALPEVAPATLGEDLGRRDFTVNAAAIALGGPRGGELRAVEGALEDLDARRLRILHDGSFNDDPTRLLRLARYAGRLGFGVERHTRELARAAVDTDALGTVSGSRLGAELRLLAREEDPVAALGALRELGLDAALDPSFGLADPEVLERALALLPAEGRRDRLAIAAAARNLGSPELLALLDRLSFEAADRDAIIATATGAGPAAAQLAAASSASEVGSALRPAGIEGAALAGALSDAAGMRRARDWLDRLRHVRLEIDGADLLAAGVDQGPAIGRGLRAALGAKLDGRVSGREQELAEALRAAR